MRLHIICRTKGKRLRQENLYRYFEKEKENLPSHKEMDHKEAKRCDIILIIFNLLSNCKY